MFREQKNVMRIVADLWGRTAKERTHCSVRGWLDHPLVQREYVQPKQSGETDMDWLHGLMTRCHVPRGGRWLSIGCGSGGAEIAFARAGVWDEMEAYDLSPAAIELARKAAAAAGVTNIRFEIGDYDNLRLAASSFDAALMIMSLHHAMNLDSVLDRVSDALRPGGFFLVNEFVGPQRFQFTDLQVDIVGKLLSALPERLRVDCHSGKVKTGYQRMPVEHWLQADPSEAAQSHEIPAAICRHFELIERVDYGGTLLNLLLEHIVHNFDAANPDDLGFIRMLALTEDLLIRHGVLPSDFALFAARKPANR